VLFEDHACLVLALCALSLPTSSIARILTHAHTHTHTHTHTHILMPVQVRSWAVKNDLNDNKRCTFASWTLLLMVGISSALSIPTFLLTFCPFPVCAVVLLKRCLTNSIKSVTVFVPYINLPYSVHALHQSTVSKSCQCASVTSIYSVKSVAVCMPYISPTSINSVISVTARVPVSVTARVPR